MYAIDMHHSQYTEHFVLNAHLCVKVQVADRDEINKNSQIYCKMTIKQFIHLADNQDECLILLDLPNYQPDIPIFLM